MLIEGLKIVRYYHAFFSSLLRFNSLELNRDTTGCCGRYFNSLRGLQIHKVRCCKQLIIKEYKSNDGIMNPDYTHSVQNPIADR